MKRTSKLKGVQKRAISSQLNDRDFLRTALLNDFVVKVSTKKLQSKKHTIFMIEQKKIALTSFDDSAFMKSCGMCYIPFGSAETRECFEITCMYNKLLLQTWLRISDT